MEFVFSAASIASDHGLLQCRGTKRAKVFMSQSLASERGVGVATSLLATSVKTMEDTLTATTIRYIWSNMATIKTRVDEESPLMSPANGARPKGERRQTKTFPLYTSLPNSQYRYAV